MPNSNNQGLHPKHEVITWISCVDEYLPDGAIAVLIRMLDSDERVWIGYWDGDNWMTAEGFKAGRVSHWADIPSGPEVAHVE